MAHRQLTDEAFVLLGAAIEDQRVEACIKQEAIALELGIDPRTYRKIESGEHKSVGLYHDVAVFLGLDGDALIEQSVNASIGFASDELGGYHKSQVENLEGHYGLYRRSFTLPGQMFFLVVAVSWSDDQQCLVFSENHAYSIKGLENVDHSQTGKIHISQTTGQMHFVTSIEGSVRLMTTTAPLVRRGRQRMHGGVFTQVESVSGFQPAFCALFLEKLEPDEVDKAVAEIGPITPDNPKFAEVLDDLQRIEKQLLITP